MNAGSGEHFHTHAHTLTLTLTLKRSRSHAHTHAQIDEMANTTVIPYIGEIAYQQLLDAMETHDVADIVAQWSERSMTTPEPKRAPIHYLIDASPALRKLYMVMLRSVLTSLKANSVPKQDLPFAVSMVTRGLVYPRPRDDLDTHYPHNTAVPNGFDEWRRAMLASIVDAAIEFAAANKMDVLYQWRASHQLHHVMEHVRAVYSSDTDRFDRYPADVKRGLEFVCGFGGRCLLA